MTNIITTSKLGNQLVIDGDAPHRWYDAVGPNVAKFIDDFVQTPFAAADSPSAYTTTLVEAGASETTVALTGGALGGALLITTDQAENDGANIQAKGEAFYFASGYPTYFGVKYQISEATQSDFLAGLCITDTDLLGGMTDGMYFRKVDASTAVEFVIEKNSIETSVASIDVQAAATDAILEFTYDGTWVEVYVDGVKTARLLASAYSTFPNDEYLTPSVHVLTGSAASITASISWLRAIQIQTT